MEYEQEEEEPSRASAGGNFFNGAYGAAGNGYGAYGEGGADAGGTTEGHGC